MLDQRHEITEKEKVNSTKTKPTNNQLERLKAIHTNRYIRARVYPKIKRNYYINQTCLLFFKQGSGYILLILDNKKLFGSNVDTQCP